MTLKAPNNYSYSTKIERVGTIVISIYEVSAGQFYHEYYELQSTGRSFFRYIYPYIGGDHGTGRIFKFGSTEYYDNIGVRYFFRLNPPATSTYTFYIEVDDRFEFYIDGVLIGEEDTAGNYTYSVDMVQDEEREFKMVYEEDTDEAIFVVDWSYTGQARQALPPSRVSGAVARYENSKKTIRCPTGQVEIDKGGYKV